MLSSDVVALGHRDSFDGPSDGMVKHRSKKRIPPTTMSFEFESPLSPSTFSSPSVSLPSSPSGFETSAAEVTPHLPRRISIMNIIRPIPKRATTQFYDEVYREGLTLRETTEATMIANDWHRKWTHQDEENHTMPERDFYQSTTAELLGYNHVTTSTSAFGINDIHQDATNDLLICLEREEGAKNPSLGSYEEAKKANSPQTISHATKRQYSAISYQQEKQTNFGSTTLHHHGVHETNSDCRHKESSTEASTVMDSSIQDNMSDTGIERPCENGCGQVDADDDQSYESYGPQHEVDGDEEPSFHNVQTTVIQRPLPIRPVVVKPVAVHAKRPDFTLKQSTNERVSPCVHRGKSRKIPGTIVTNQFNGADIVSPMSYSQYTRSSTLSSPSTLTNDLIGTTILKTNEDGLFLIEDDREQESTKKDNELDSISTKADRIVKARDDILHILAINDGDVDSEDFKSKVDPLENYFLGMGYDTREVSRYQHHDSARSSISGTSVATSVEGMWLTLSKPNYFGMLGHNDNGDPMYTLGRMSFDMFSPTNLVCSLQGNFNRIEVVGGEERKTMLNAVPSKLREEVEGGKTILRTYQIVTAFTIEPSMAAYPNAPNKDVTRPIRGIMTTFGYSLPDPKTANRHSIWFTGGRIEPNDDANDIRMWKDFFELHPPKHSFGEKAKLLAVKLLMGATIPDEIDPDDGSMSYEFTRPLGGHGMAYVDVIYLDDSLRIGRGQRGTTFVFSRVPDV